MILDIRDISKKYGTQTALKQTSFSIRKGEIVGFLGPNGAGKSTTMKIITGYLPPDTGKVSICGYQMDKEPLKAKMEIGYLPEHNSLYEEMYVVEFLEYVLKIYKPDFSIKEKIKETIHLTGLFPEYHKKIGQLSKGYRQRVGLAQALIHEPSLLVLDEPLTGLDPNQADEIKELLSNIGKEKAILFSSHTLSDVSSVCSRIIIIKNGNIILDQPESEIKDLPNIFRELTKTQND